MSGLPDLRPTFCLTVPDNRLARVGLLAGDLLLCDRETNPARFVIGVWDGRGHLCTNIDGRLFDEATRSFAPEGAQIQGRVLGLLRQILPLAEAETPA